jgi:hypothetical protein
MHSRHQPNPNLHQPDDLFYVETDIAPGLTLDQARRNRPSRPSRWQRLKELAGGANVAMAHAAQLGAL